MFRPPVSAIPLLVGAMIACLGALGCTNSSCVPSWALLIKVESANGAVAADTVMVSFDGGEAYACPADVAEVGTYTCAGNQNGTYAVTVVLDGDSMTQDAALDADVCGVIEPQQLDFAFESAPAAGPDAGAN